MQRMGKVLGSVSYTKVVTEVHREENQGQYSVIIIVLICNPYYKTATHGTGINVGNLAALVTKLKFVSGKGEV